MFLIYSKSNCPYCYKVKQVIEMTGNKFVEYSLDRDFTKQEFYDKFGEGSTFPQVLHDDKKLEVALTRSNSSENRRSSPEDINNSVPNRGVDFILNGGRRKHSKNFHIIFEKMVCFFRREVTIYFEFSLKARKKR